MQIQLYDRFTYIHNEMRNILHTLPKEGLMIHKEIKLVHYIES